MLAHFLTPYASPRELTGGIGNHTFAIECGSNEVIVVPSAIRGTLDDLALSENTYALILREGERVQKMRGLTHHIISEYSDIPMVIFDNHNHALYWWHAAMNSGIIEAKSMVVHIDAHSDLWSNPNDLSLEASKDPETLWQFVNEKCTVANYVEPALRSGLVGEFIRVEGAEQLEMLAERDFSPEKNLILNLDIDFFMEELEYISSQRKIEVIRAVAQQARLITVATSPGFIDQSEAIRRVKEIFD